METYNDHRMAMSLALIGLKVPGVVIKNPGCVAKRTRGFGRISKSCGASWRPASSSGGPSSSAHPWPLFRPLGLSAPGNPGRSQGGFGPERAQTTDLAEDLVPVFPL